jgi:hypothetical protein
MQNPSYGYICTKPKSAQSGMESNSEGADGDQHPSTDGECRHRCFGAMDSVSGELQVLYFDPMSHILWRLLFGI